MDEGAAQRVREFWTASGVNAFACTLVHADARFDEFESVVREIGRWAHRFSVADYLTHCRTANDLDRAFQGGKVGVILSLQSPGCVDHDLERLDLLHHLGVGIFQLTYNTRSLLGDGCAERTDSGLSRLGVAAIKRMNELGMIVDASHCGRATSLDAIALSDRPISFTHTGCRAVFDHPRNKTDDELRALGERDGYVGIYTIPWALTDDDQFGMGPFLDHIDHAVGVAGIGRVGIGTDWGAPSPEFPDALRASLFESIVGGSLQAAGSSRPKPRALGELSSYRQWRQITRGLVSRGYSDDEVRGIIGGNFLQFFRRISGQGDEAAAIAGSARTAAHG